MKKLSTFFKKDPRDLGRVINEIDPINDWVLDYGVPTRKFDGTSCAIIGGRLYKRFDLKKGRKLPINSIPCQDADIITGHHPHWTLCIKGESSNKYHFEAFNKMQGVVCDGTYELCGEKVQGNPENLKGHELIKHGSELFLGCPKSFEGIRNFLLVHDIEGIVFHNKKDNRMCKIRKSDFGIKR